MSLWTIRCAIRWLQGWRPADKEPDGQMRLVWADGATMPALAYKDRGTWWIDEEVYVPNVRWVQRLPNCPYC